MIQVHNQRYPQFIICAAFILALGVAAMGCSGSGSPAGASVSRIVVPDEVTAGSTIEVVVEGSGPGDVELDVIDAFAVTTFAATINGGRATVTLPPALTSTSGLVTFVARGGEPGDRVVATTAIVPEVVASTVDIHAGPRTIVADGADQTMVTAIAADRFGNPLPDDETVIISLIEESGPGLDVPVDIEHGLAARLISSGTSAGGVEVFATTADGVSSRRVGFDEVPGSASSVQAVLPESPPLVADGRTVVEVSTTVITDRFANRIPDGHLVQLQSNGPNGVGVATATTIDGTARFRLLAPSRPGNVSIAVTVDGLTGEAAELVFTPAVSSIPVEIARDDLDRAAVRVGPVLDELGAVVTDGTPVTATIGDRLDPVEVPLLNGMAVIDVGPLFPQTEVEVEVLGVTRTATE